MMITKNYKILKCLWNQYNSTVFFLFCFVFFQVFAFVFKQGLIKLHGIQKKEMYQRIQPETGLYIVEGGKEINANWEREYCNQKQLQNVLII